jgi:hypothetical protein
MKNTLLLLSLNILFALSATRFASAQGTAFTFQGLLTDNGVQVNGSHDLRLELYDAPNGGSPLGMNMLEDVPITDGLVAVQVDFGGGVFNGGPRWMEIAVRPGASSGGFTVLPPRQELTPTPYAIYATRAGSRQPGQNAGVGGVALSQTLALANVTSTTFVELPLTVELQTVGRPVLVFLTAGTDPTSSYVRVNRQDPDNAGRVAFVRDGAAIVAEYESGQRSQIVSGSVQTQTLPPSSFQCLDVPGPGAHTYTVRIRNAYPGQSTSMQVRNIRLVAMEL